MIPFLMPEAFESAGWLLPKGEGEVQTAVGMDGCVWIVLKDFGETTIDRVFELRRGDPNSQEWHNLPMPGQVGLLMAGRHDLLKQLQAGRTFANLPGRRYLEGALVLGYLGRIHNRAVLAFLAGDEAKALGLMSHVVRWQSIRLADKAAGAPEYQLHQEDGLRYIQEQSIRLAGSIEAGRRRAVREAKPYDAEYASGLEPVERIKYLVSHLSEVRQRGVVIPGGATFDGDPVFDSLVKEGEAAIPELERAKGDQELLRIGYQRRPGTDIHVYSVGDVADRVIWRIKNPRKIGSPQDVGH